ncbi:UNVERIFIED_CONTAM: Retrovirus-related Pol polyprotein from transposon RE2 [Sesamum radiatum]|uniref:Retrovirus-related Pol polyprotein from transposon RE2 n=1 Tax=Sesamum radiatum TaxID=300843 RepID=A0AAW2L0R7_SESRA
MITVLFTMVTDPGHIFLLVYVDDILIAGTSLSEIQKTKYTLDIIKDAGLLYSKAATTRLPQGLKFAADCGAKLQHPDAYRKLIGRLLYLGFTRPDISHSVQQLSQCFAHPCEGHWSAALHIVSVYVFLGATPISWKTKKQSTISRSTAEAEYWNLAATICELHWISYILKDLGVDIVTPIPLFCDNKAILHIMANTVFHERTKHIEIDCHIVRDAYKDGFILPSHIKGTDQIADIFTKLLPFKSFATMVSKLELVSLIPSPTCRGGC